MADALVIANIILGMGTAFLQFSCAIKRCNPDKRGAHLTVGAIALYWGAIYVWVLLDSVGALQLCNFLQAGQACGNINVWFGQVFIRPAFTVTLAGMLAMALRRWKGL